MGKLGNTILMLKLLSNGRIYTINELSKIIEVSPRQIRTYKEELEKAGIYIDSYAGRNGGYGYSSKIYKEEVGFDVNDLNNLEKIYLELDDAKDIKNNLYQTIEKVRSIVLFSNAKESNNTENFQMYHKIFSRAIVDEETLVLTIKKPNIKEHNRLFVAHSIYVRSGNYYVTGFCLTDNEIRTFPFYEIKNIKKY